MGPSSRRIKADIDATLDKLNDDVNRLADRLNPRNLTHRRRRATRAMRLRRHRSPEEGAH
ncbi:DUF3618 domain-containing protein [Streptomyces sp. YIM 98790]|uniref:DUF3618 domain-containing protein n=1 Tax=Streptomyces sp. YIM 98790 TaxID=2689077 RepID=UPI00140BF79B|nr:DUF3618 domain-containing protein [Streptomyces sp. YIM 98790]